MLCHVLVTYRSKEVSQIFGNPSGQSIEWTHLPVRCVCVQSPIITSHTLVSTK